MYGPLKEGMLPAGLEAAALKIIALAADRQFTLTSQVCAA